jgi:hypothetical protein
LTLQVTIESKQSKVIDSSLLFSYRKFLTWDWFSLPFRHVDIIGVKIVEPSSRIIHLTKKLASKGKNQKKKAKEDDVMVQKPLLQELFLFVSFESHSHLHLGLR